MISWSECSWVSWPFACVLTTSCLLEDLKNELLHIPGSLWILDYQQSALAQHTSQTLFMLCVAWTQRSTTFVSRKKEGKLALFPGASLLIIHYFHYHCEPLYPKVPLIGGSSAKSHIVPNYNFTNGPLKTTLTFYTWLIPEQGHSAVANRNAPPSVPTPQTTIQLAWI